MLIFPKNDWIHSHKIRPAFINITSRKVPQLTCFFQIKNSFPKITKINLPQKGSVLLDPNKNAFFSVCACKNSRKVSFIFPSSQFKLNNLFPYLIFLTFNFQFVKYKKRIG